MSRSYLLKIPLHVLIPESELEKRRVMKIGFDLLNILSPERMRELLKAAMEKKGAREVNGKLELVQPDQSILRVDPGSGRLEVDVSGMQTQSVDIRVLDDRVPGIKKMIDEGDFDQVGMNQTIMSEVKAQLQHQTDQDREILVVKTLAGKKLLNEVLKDVYRDAVKEKAATMGNVVSLTESSEGGNYRLRLEIK